MSSEQQAVSQHLVQVQVAQRRAAKLQERVDAAVEGMEAAEARARAAVAAEQAVRGQNTELEARLDNVSAGRHEALEVPHSLCSACRRACVACIS